MVSMSTLILLVCLFAVASPLRLLKTSKQRPQAKTLRQPTRHRLLTALLLNLLVPADAAKSLYSTLGVPKNANPKEIKRAYRKQAKQWHPDKHLEKDKEKATVEFRKIADAYETLSDHRKRELYNRSEEAVKHQPRGPASSHPGMRRPHSTRGGVKDDEAPFADFMRQTRAEARHQQDTYGDLVGNLVFFGSFFGRGAPSMPFPGFTGMEGFWQGHSSFSQAKASTFSYFRFTPTELRGSSANAIQLSKIRLANGESQLDLSTATVTNPGGDSPSREEPPKAIDGDITTKWLDFNKGGLVLVFPVAVSADRFSFTTGDDFADRDPVSWRLEVSMDGIAYNAVQQRFGYSTTTGRLLQSPWLPFDFVGEAMTTSCATLKLRQVCRRINPSNERPLGVSQTQCAARCSALKALGCCEWQVDHSTCVFHPGSGTVPISGDSKRWASSCVQAKQGEAFFAQDGGAVEELKFMGHASQIRKLKNEGDVAVLFYASGGKSCPKACHRIRTHYKDFAAARRKELPIVAVQCTHRQGLCAQYADKLPAVVLFSKGASQPHVLSEGRAASVDELVNSVDRALAQDGPKELSAKHFSSSGDPCGGQFCLLLFERSHHNRVGLRAHISTLSRARKAFKNTARMLKDEPVKPFYIKEGKHPDFVHAFGTSAEAGLWGKLWGKRAATQALIWRPRRKTYELFDGDVQDSAALAEFVRGAVHRGTPLRQRVLGTPKLSV